MKNEITHIKLSELNSLIKGCIQDNFAQNYWIIAEIGEIKFNRNGHAYLELIEKAETALEEAKRDASRPIHIWILKSPFWVRDESLK